jgi:endoglucanase
MKSRFVVCISLCTALLVHGSAAAEASATDAIRVNQIGFYPEAPKIAVVVSIASDSFQVLDAATSVPVFSGGLSKGKRWPHSDETVQLADFSALEREGTYVLVVGGIGESHVFDIKPFVHQEVARAGIKAFYFQRASMELALAYAGKWKRRMGHPDDKVKVHASAATAARPENTLINCAKGWYDAGDYNKYIVNSGISVGTLLSLYETFPAYCEALITRIPETGNGTPDLLSETLWNLRWMLSMQDPDDGGVYHKCTNANFDGMVMPHVATSPRYVVQKSTAAALDFAAVMAQANRVYQPFFPGDFVPTFADSCLEAARRAWDWARKNPAVLYRQNDMNQLYNPDITTGTYGDSAVSDEFAWAGMELFTTTGEDSFLAASDPFRDPDTPLPAWPNVRTLGYYSLFLNRARLAPGAVDTTALKVRLTGLAGPFRSTVDTSAYGVAMGTRSGDFEWGSNSVAANQGIACIQAFLASGDSAFLWAALTNLDYLLGRNATGYSFVTGYGDKTPMHIHHRPSEADGIKDPVPGFLAGGPNPGQEDRCAGYPSELPALSYVDAMCSYASNEICINWNAPLVYLSCAIEAILSPDGKPDVSGILARTSGPSKSFRLPANYPNPFNASTTIRFSLETPSAVTVAVFDAEGRRVSAPVKGKKFGAGVHDVRFDASALPSGIYLYRIEAGKERLTGRMTLVK